MGNNKKGLHHETYNTPPKSGRILECDFGEWVTQPNFDGHLPPEMCKKRMVIVLNGNLNGLCQVVPISSTKTIGMEAKYHVELDTSFFPITDFYDKRQRWAKAELIQPVSKQRLFHILDDNKQKIQKYLPFEVVEQIQFAAIDALNASRLLAKK